MKMNSVENCPFCATMPYYEMVQGLNGQPATHKIVCPHCGVTIKGKSKEEVFEKWNHCRSRENEEEKRYYNSLVASIRRVYDEIPLCEQRNCALELSPSDYVILKTGCKVTTLSGFYYSTAIFGIDVEINRNLQKGEFRLARQFKVRYLEV